MTNDELLEHRQPLPSGHSEVLELTESISEFNHKQPDELDHLLLWHQARHELTDELLDLGQALRLMPPARGRTSPSFRMSLAS